jgi:hypothetical protein
MNERDDKICKDIGKHGVSIRAVIEKRFFDGATGDHVINRLLKEGRIVSESGLPGGLCYYHLSLSEARALSIPEHRAKPKKGAALRKDLQVLWFCSMSEKNRSRLERKQVAKEFGDGRGSGKPHCAEADDGKLIVYRIYAPGPHSRDDYVLKSIQTDYEDAVVRPELKGWVENQMFGFAVLVETPERKERLKRLINKNGPQGARIIVEIVPGLGTIGMMLRKLQERRDVVHA